MARLRVFGFFFVAVALSFGVIFVLATRGQSPRFEANDGKIRVTASFYPLAEFVRQVGGDAVVVTTVTPAGVEPHDFEPTPQQIAGAYAAQLFVYNGGGLDVWADKLVPSLAIENIATVSMLDALDERPGDPHVWLDPVLARREVDVIRDALIAVDVPRTNLYMANATAYNQKLAQLDSAYREGLASCAKRTLITSHAAFAYMANEYGFAERAVLGMSPDEEPTSNVLAELANVARAENIRYVVFETLVNPRIAQTLAREIGAQTLVVNPLEGLTNDEIAAGKTYLSVMNDNLAQLKIALACP